jgi:polysaccharide transporter, PST family
MTLAILLDGEQHMSRGTILKGALILSVAGVITKILSAIYRVPYQNMAGDIGFYVYQQVYPFYGMAIIFATIGFPIVISKYVAEYRQKSPEKVKEFILVALISLEIAGLLLFFLFYFTAPLIANLMEDANLVLSIRAIALVFIIVPFVATMRGFFQGKEEMLPTAITQISEQLIRISIILSFTYVLVYYQYSPYIIGAGAAFGSVMGLLFAAFILFFMSRKYFTFQDLLASFKKLKEYRKLIRNLYIQGFAICISGMALILFQAVDAFTVVPFLSEANVNLYDAKVLKGVFDRGQPLIQLGTVIATAIALPLIPMLATAKLQGRWSDLQRKAELAIRTSLVFGSAATIGLLVIVEQTNMMLFTDAKGSDVLFIMSISIFFSSLATTSSAILQGVGSIAITARHVMYGLIVKVILSFILIPIFFTIGAAIATVVSFAVISILNLRLLKHKISSCLPTTEKLVRISFATMFLFIIALGWKLGVSFLIDGLFSARIDATITALSTAMIGALFYLITILFFGVYHADELRVLPLANKFPQFKQLKKRGMKL